MFYSVQSSKDDATLTIQIMAVIKIRETVPLPGGRCGHWNQIEPDSHPDSPH